MAASSHEEILLDDFGVDMKLVKPVLDFITEQGIPFDETKFASSNGMSCVIVPRDGPVVYQLYRSRETFDKIVAFCREIQLNCETSGNPACKFLVKHRAIIDKYNCIVFDKILPLNGQFSAMLHLREDIKPFQAFISARIGKIREQIGAAVDFIASLGFAHGDVKLDNIGIDSDGDFVLFDYDGLSRKDGHEEDLDSLEKSIRYWLSERKGGAKTRKRKLTKQKKRKTRGKNRKH